MLAAMALAATFADCVPMRWISATPASLALLEGTPVSCLLLSESQWSPELIQAAQARGQRLLAVATSPQQASRAAPLHVDAVVLEGDFAWSGAKPTIRLGSRQAIRFNDSAPVLGTLQGVWPGIEIEHGGPKTSAAAPTGSAWIHTNTGFLRYVRSAAKVPFWMANTPPPNVEWTASRYAQAVADAAATGARWVIALDERMRTRLLAADAAALAEWKKIMETTRFYESHPQWRAMQPWAQVAIVQDEASGALVTGSLLDMLSVMNTPVRAVPPRALSHATIEGAKVTVSVNPSAYTAEQHKLMERFAGQGGKVVTGPKAWKMPEATNGKITFDKAQYKELEAIWPELHLAVQRKNFGVRMFNVTGVLSYLLRNDTLVVLHLVNYTDYPVENITAFVQGKYRTAKFLTPDGKTHKVTIYDAPDGTAVEIQNLGVCGAVVLEP